MYMISVATSSQSDIGLVAGAGWNLNGPWGSSSSLIVVGAVTVTNGTLKELVRERDNALESPGKDENEAVETVDEVDKSFFNPILGATPDDGPVVVACERFVMLAVS
jgi:hypothetical protein